MFINKRGKRGFLAGLTIFYSETDWALVSPWDLGVPMHLFSSFGFFYLPLILPLLKNKYYLLLIFIVLFIIPNLDPKVFLVLFLLNFISVPLDVEDVEPEWAAAQLPHGLNPQLQITHISISSLPFLSMLILPFFPTNFMFQHKYSSSEKANCGQ